ncbi:hypothetical protein ACLKA7_013105 [Drosophila subpalustris]
MKFDLTVDNGPCETDLRTWCMGIAIYTLFSIVLSVLITPSVFTFIGLAIAVITNACLLIGCRRENHMLIAVWFIYAILLAINFPFALLGTIFHFGGYRESTGMSNVFGALLVHVVVFILGLFCARIVYSYYLQLKNRESRPQAVPVV